MRFGIALRTLGTSRIHLGTAVLILPYRPALPTAKAIATIQDLSDERRERGASAMRPWRSFTPHPTPRTTWRFRTASLFSSARIRSGHASGSAEPRPTALARAARYGDSWLPMTDDPDALRSPIAELAARFAAAGRGKKS